MAVGYFYSNKEKDFLLFRGDYGWYMSPTAGHWPDVKEFIEGELGWELRGLRLDPCDFICSFNLLLWEPL